jgi:hypothetical protein
MNCSLTNTVTNNPVLVNGHICDESVILKYLAHTSTCPFTQKPLAASDLIKVNCDTLFNSTPSSIPQLLQDLRNSFDLKALEVFELNKKVLDLQQQLSISLYENDASKRVIARLLEQKQLLLKSIADNTAHKTVVEAENNKPETQMLVELDEKVLEIIDKTATELTNMRKGRKVSPSLASADQISSFTDIKHSSKSFTFMDLLKDHIVSCDPSHIFVFSLDLKELAQVKIKNTLKVMWIDSGRCIAFGTDFLKVFEISLSNKKGKINSLFTLDLSCVDVQLHPSLGLFSVCLKESNQWELRYLDSGDLVFSCPVDSGKFF